MCYHLLIISPLTLSEVRSMLPGGLAADLFDPPTLRRLRPLLPNAETVAGLVHGACSCDLVVERQPVSREDEAWLRRRYRAAGLSRTETIRALDAHRRASEKPPRPAGHWPVALAAFVAEHARNAGPTVYLLHFAHDGAAPALPAVHPVTRSVREVVEEPGEWLHEGVPVRVTP
jgi:hypothetical protein